MFKGVNWVAVAVSVILVEVLGFLWYGPVFGKAWLAAFTASLGRPPTGGAMAVTMSLGVVNSLILVFGLAWIVARLGAAGTRAIALAVGIWFLFDFTTMAVEYLYMGLSPALVGLNMGYQLAAYAITGAVLAFMPRRAG